MQKQKIPLCLRHAIWISYNRKSGYEEIPIDFLEMEIDHIVPERVLLNPKEPGEFEKWKKKYNLDRDFNIQGIENLCPSTRKFNLMKSDHGLYDEADTYKEFIIRALVKARHLKPKIEELRDKNKSRLDKRQTMKIVDLIKFLKEGTIDIKILISEGLKVDYNEMKDIEAFFIQYTIPSFH